MAQGRLTRDDLFGIATLHGWKKGQPLTEPQKESVRQELKTSLQSHDFAPTRVFDGNGGFRLMSLEEAVENLLEELV